MSLDVHEALGGFKGVHLRTTEKALHLYTEGAIQFDPHPAADTNADFYMRMQDVRSLVRGDADQ